jgi:nicotinate dehydrogenase subunit A
MAQTLQVNRHAVTVDVDDPDTPLFCGAARQHRAACAALWLRTRSVRRVYRPVEGTAVRSCVTPLSSFGAGRVVTLEGLSPQDDLHPLQQAFIDEQAVQCGYCINGIIVQAASLVQSALVPASIAGSMKDGIFSGFFQHTQNRCGAAKEVEPAVVGGDLLIGSGAGTEKATQLVVGAKEFASRPWALEPAHRTVAAFDAAMILLQSSSSPSRNSSIRRCAARQRRRSLSRPAAVWYGRLPGLVYAPAQCRAVEGCPDRARIAITPDQCCLHPQSSVVGEGACARGLPCPAIRRHRFR